MTKRKLPKLNAPTFTTELPVSKQTITYRGFTTKEQKILLVAKESNDVEQAILAAEQVINNCVVDEDFDIDRISIIDFTWIMIAIRSKSVSDRIELTFKDDETEEEIKGRITLDNSVLVYPEDKTDYSKIEHDGATIFLKQPGWRTFKKMISQPENSALQFEIMVDSFDKLVMGDEVYDFAEFDQNEIEEFIDGLPDTAGPHLEKFYLSSPILRHEFKYKRPSDGAERQFTIEGFDGFFT